RVLTIRAGAGYAPVIKPTPAAVKADESLLSTRAALTLEGLELHHEGLPKSAERSIVGSVEAPLFLTNCKLVVNPGKPHVANAIISYGGSSRGLLRNCLIISRGNAVLWSASRRQWEIDNCQFVNGDDNLASPVVLVLDQENAPGARLRLSRNTVVGGVSL